MAGRKLTKEQKEAIVLLGGALSGPLSGPAAGAPRVAAIGTALIAAVAFMACDQPAGGTGGGLTNEGGGDENGNNNGENGGGGNTNGGGDGTTTPKTPEQIAQEKLAQLTTAIQTAEYTDTEAAALANIITQDKQGTFTLANLAYAVSKKNGSSAAYANEVANIITITAPAAPIKKESVETAFSFIATELTALGSNTDLNSGLMPEGQKTWTQRRGGPDGEIAFLARHLAIKANAQAIGNEPATVFLGDGLILEAVGGRSETAIKTDMPNIPTARVHVAAIEGATVEEIKWGIENGWLPLKTAYTVVHGGRAEVMGNESSLINSSQITSEPFGQKIGEIYTTLKIARPQTSVIFSGIIPPTGHSIHSDNIAHINGNNGIKSIVPNDTQYNLFMSSNQNTTVTSFKNDIDETFLYQAINTTVSSAKRANQQAVRLATVAQGCRVAQGCQSPFWGGLTLVV